MSINGFIKQHIFHKSAKASVRQSQKRYKKNTSFVITSENKVARLVEEAQQGNIKAFGKLYDLFVDRVYRFIFFRIGKKEDAEDLTEEIFLKTFKNIATYKQKTDIPFEAWLFRIVRNRIIDYYRTRKESASIEQAESVFDTKPGPEEQTVQNIQVQEVLAALVKLPQQYQDIIILKFIEEKSNEEISFILGKSVAHIRVIQSRALKALRQKIKYNNYENEKTYQFAEESQVFTGS